jgi:phosphatidylethanolamine-binding protein (PEBP) family uncharacterized protein
MKTILLVPFALFAASPAVAADMAVSFSWCGTRSPDFTLANVPKGTAQLDLRMVDLFVPGYPHGGGKLAFKGQKAIPCGAITSGFEGPSPPPPQVHEYQWTVKALDAGGQVLATAKASRRYPER